jgi:hypothetical protein
MTKADQLAKVEDAMAADPDLARQAFTWKTLLAIIDTELVPKEYRGNVPKALAAILAGRERGLGPMLSMHYIDVIDGRGAPSGEYMVAQIFKAGHIIYASELTDISCTAMGIRRENGEDIATMQYTFDMTMAERAGINTKRDGGLKANWKHYPEAMLYWRATSQLARMFFADAIAGLSHIAIELDLDRNPEPIPDEHGVIEDTPPFDSEGRPLPEGEVLDEAEAIAADLREQGHDVRVVTGDEAIEAEVIDEAVVVDVTEAITEKARAQATSHLEWEVALDTSARVKCKNLCERKDPYSSDSYCCEDAHLRRLYGLATVAFDIPHDDSHADLLHQALDKHQPGARHVGDLNKVPLEALINASKVKFTEMLYGGEPAE